MFKAPIHTNRFSGRSALITGCGSENGIGFAAARLLVLSGAAVAITSTTDRIYERQKTLSELGGNAAAFVADLTDTDQVARLAESASAAMGRIDILVNNAGMTQVGEPETFHHLVDVPPDEWRKSMDRNLTTCYLMTRAVLPAMLDRGYGRIVNVSSVTGPLVSNPGETAYSAAKAAMVGLSRSLAIETSAQGVTVNCVGPGWITTGSTAPAEVVAGQNTPMKRAGTPEEVAWLIAFLASDEAAYITGQLMVVDGGNCLQEYKGPSQDYY